MTEKATNKEYINASEIDLKFKYELAKMHGGEKLFRCFQCGKCTLDYPVARYGNTYSARADEANNLHGTTWPQRTRFQRA